MGRRLRISHSLATRRRCAYPWAHTSSRGAHMCTVAKKYNSPNQPEGTRKEGTSVLHNVQVTPQG